MNQSNKLAGWFVGTCTNTTIDTTANLLLRIHGATDTRMHGELNLSGNLGGGGPFHATLHQRWIRFTTCLPALLTVIEWSGERTADGFSGSYKVTCDAPDPERGVFAEQEGVWSCAFVRGPVDPDSEPTESVLVFNAGASEGPFVLDEFVQHAVDERWPPHALVARSNGAAWSTIRECITELQAQTVGAN